MTRLLQLTTARAFLLLFALGELVTVGRAHSFCHRYCNEAAKRLCELRRRR
jgi:hypothetical protein